MKTIKCEYNKSHELATAPSGAKYYEIAGAKNYGHGVEDRPKTFEVYRYENIQEVRDNFGDELVDDSIDEATSRGETVADGEQDALNWANEYVNFIESLN
jgi:hypothetical protein